VVTIVCMPMAIRVPPKVGETLVTTTNNVPPCTPPDSWLLLQKAETRGGGSGLLSWKPMLAFEARR